MGATLPILVAHVTRLWGNVGKSIGLLYQVNTFGAAFGVAIVGFVWFLSVRARHGDPHGRRC